MLVERLELADEQARLRGLQPDATLVDGAWRAGYLAYLLGHRVSQGAPRWDDIGCGREYRAGYLAANEDRATGGVTL